MCLCEAVKSCVVQVRFRGTSRSCAGQAALQRRQKRRCSQQPAPAHDPAKYVTLTFHLWAFNCICNIFGGISLDFCCICQILVISVQFSIAQFTLWLLW